MSNSDSPKAPPYVTTPAQLDAAFPQLRPLSDVPAPEASAPAVALVPPSEPATPEVPFDVYTQVDLRVGVILSAQAIPKKKKLLDLSIDLGEAAPRRVISGLALARKPEDLTGLRVLVVTNLPPRDFGGGLISRGMILAASYGDDLALVTVDRPAAAGTRAT